MNRLLWGGFQNKISVLNLKIQYYIYQSMSENTKATNTARQSAITKDAVSVSLQNILSRLALESNIPQQFTPNNWGALHLKHPIEVDASAPPSTNEHYQLQHQAFAVYDNTSKSWKLHTEGNHIASKLLGVIGSKKKGVRAIQLPNHTHKTIVGLISAEHLLESFSAPEVKGTKVSIIPKEHAQIAFASVTPVLHQHKIRTQSPIKSQYKHLEYVLHSSKESQQVRSNLSWSQSPKKTLTVVNGSDIEDLSRYKEILASLRAQDQSNNSHISGSQRQNIEKRLLLLEHQIDGLLKRKINYTSRDSEGTRFLDYTTILNEKQNQIITLHKQIQNLEVRLKERSSEKTQLSAQIQRLNTVIKTLNNSHATRQDIDNLLLSNFEAINLHKQAKKLHSKVSESRHIIKNHLHDLSLKGVKVEGQAELHALVDENKDSDIRVSEGIVHVVETKDKIIEVPLQDAKTKELIKQMGIQLYRIYERYPKVKDQADPHFVELLNKQVLNVVDKDGLTKITEIIKYVPSLIKVENIYSVNNDKQRKLEFHLRVLLKALLTEFQKIKEKTGVNPEIDESVVTMIHEQINDVSIDDILKVFQVNHKIVQVPKIVEKIVERVIEVPVVMPVEKIVEKIVYETKIEEIQKVVHVPVEVIKYVDRIVQKVVEVDKIKEKVVEVPKIVEKIVEKRVEVPKIVEVQVIKEKIVEVEKPVIVERVVNQAVPQIKQVQVIKQQTVVVKETIEKIKEVEVIVQKIVERIVQKPVIIEVEKIIQKLVNTVNYKTAKQVVNHIEQVPQIVQRVVEKVIPIIQIVERIKEVPKIVQKIVEVKVEVPTVKEVKVIEEKIVYQDRIKQIEKTIEKVVPLIREVIKEVQRKVEVPIIQQKIVKVIEYIEKTVPERYETVKIVEIQKIKEKLVQVIKIVQVQKPIFKYITVEKPVKVIVETIVQVPKIVERIKEVRVPVDKIIQKLVEVPKVVQVQKIVQKIVVVPRIVEKIVEVPQIIEKIVDRVVEVEKIKEVVREVNIPIYTQKIVEVQIIKNIEVPIYKEIQVIREKIVPAIQEKQIIKNVEVIKEKLVQARVQIPKEVSKDKIVTQTHQIQKIIQVEKPIVIPFEVPVPCDKIVEKLILVEKEVEKIKEVPVEIDRLVEVIKEVPTVKEITKVEERPIVHQKIKEIQKIVPYISQQIKQVEVIREKPVLTTQLQEKIKEISAIQQKIVQVVHEVPKIYQVEKVVEKSVEVPRYIQITAKEPVIITNNKIVDKLVDKVVQVVVVEQQIVSVPTIQEKIVTVEKLVEIIRQVYLNTDKIVEQQKLISRTNVQNKIETQFKTVDRIEEKLVPVSGSYEKIVEVPHLMEKVVQRIVLMPQVHQVTQHIIDVQEESHPGIAVDVQFHEHQAKYNKLYSNLKKDTSSLIVELKAMKKAHPQLSSKLENIENYVSQLDQITAFPKIVQVTKDKVVQKEVAVPVLLNRKSEDSIKRQAYYLVLVQKLIKELKNAKAKSSYGIEDEEIKLLFMNQISKDEDGKIKDQVESFRHSKEGKKYSSANDSLLNEVLYDKFYLSSQLEKSKLETERFRRISDERLTLLHKYKQTNDILHKRLQTIEENLRSLVKKDGSTFNKAILQKIKTIESEIEELNELLYSDINYIKVSEPIQSIFKGSTPDINYRLQQSRIRQLEAEIQLLRREYIDKAGSIISNQDTDKDRVIDSLRKTITHLAENKGTKTTLGGDDDRSIVSFDKAGEKGTKKDNQTSILRYIPGSPRKGGANNQWDQFPIIQEESQNSQNFGYVVLPHGKIEGEHKTYKVIENKDNESYIILPVGDHTPKKQQQKEQILHKGHKESKQEESKQSYPFGNPWLPLAQNQQKAAQTTSNNGNVAQTTSNNSNGETLKKSTAEEEESKNINISINKNIHHQKKSEDHDVHLKGSQQKSKGQWVSPKKITFNNLSHSNVRQDVRGQSSLNIEPSAINQEHSQHLIVAQPQYTVIQPPLQPSVVNFSYQQQQQQPTIIIPNIYTPENILNLPGQTSKIIYYDEHGVPVQLFNQTGHVSGEGPNGGTYEASYLYKSEVKEEGSGEHRIEKKITEIRTNQTVNWISRSRVIDTEVREESPRRESPSPPKDNNLSPPK